MERLLWYDEQIDKEIHDIAQLKHSLLHADYKLHYIMRSRINDHEWYRDMFTDSKTRLLSVMQILLETLHYPDTSILPLCVLKHCIFEYLF